MTIQQAPKGRLALFPISIFSITLGLGGWTIATQKLAALWSFSPWMAAMPLVLDILIFVVLFLLYAAKVFIYREEVRHELNHPIKLNFFPTISIGLILMSIAFLDLHSLLSRGLYAVGGVLHLSFTLYILRDWIVQEHYEIHHMNPAWFIPVVGNILIPIAGVAHGVQDLSWFFFSVGIVMWIVLFAIVTYRMILHHSLPDRLVPTLFILVAPPAVGFIAYVKLTGTLDPFARILYFFALFMILVLCTLFGKFRKIQFYLSWWAYSFPVAAATIASMLMSRMTGSIVYSWLASALWCLLSVLIMYLFFHTVLSITRKEVCVEE